MDYQSYLENNDIIDHDNSEDHDRSEDLEYLNIELPNKIHELKDKMKVLKNIIKPRGKKSRGQQLSSKCTSNFLSRALKISSISDIS